MKNFNTKTTTKPSYVKTKAYGLCGVLALTTALLFGAGAVSADENTQPVPDTQSAVSNVYTADNAGNVTVTPSTETTAPVAEATPVETQPVVETPVTTEATPVVENTVTATETPTAITEAAPTTTTKEGDTINVENPNVEVTFPNGNGKYSAFNIEYKDIHIPDDVDVNEGDKVTFDLPEEVKFQTSYEFDVHNPEKVVVGKATADANTNKVTTVFNNYFTTHPLNKQMSLKLDAQWTDKVESGKPVKVNFNGTVVSTNIGKEQVIGEDELIAKWGSQDKDDPSVINWTARINYAKRVLNYVTIIDEMSENQKLVDNFFEIKNIESVDPWIDKGSAMDLVKSISKSDHGFEIKMNRLDHMIYINYKTRLVNAVKDSVNPTNKIELKAESDGATSYSYVQLVGGKGDASGENKPVWEIPNDAPKYEKPSINIEDIPLLPPAPIVEIPEWKGGVTPPDAPSIDKPEFEGGVVPNEAPVYYKPELEIPEEPTKPTPSEPVKPNTPKEMPNKPVDAPKTNEVVTTTVAYRNDSEASEGVNTAVYGGATLPNTGEKEGNVTALGLVVLVSGIAGLTLAFKKQNY